MTQVKFFVQLCGLLSVTGNYEFLAKDSVLRDLKQGVLGKVGRRKSLLVNLIQVSNLVTGGWLPTQNVLFDMSGVPQATQASLSCFLVFCNSMYSCHQELLEEIVSHEPSGTSSRNIHHFGQAVNTQEFCAYNFPTPEENLAAYGSEEPPKYKLEEVTCPVLLFWGQKDWMAQPRGVAAIAARLPHLIDSVKVSKKTVGRHI